MCVTTNTLKNSPDGEDECDGLCPDIRVRGNIGNHQFRFRRFSAALSMNFFSLKMQDRYKYLVDDVRFMFFEHFECFPSLSHFSSNQTTPLESMCICFAMFLPTQLKTICHLQLHCSHVKLMLWISISLSI